MKKGLLTLWLSIFALVAGAQTFETAAEAVDHMKIGWNLGNTLDSNSGDSLNMWIEWNPTVANYEKAWGQPLTTKALIHMFKEAGFNAIRVPVTWYPHMGIMADGSCKQRTVDGNYRMVWNLSQWKRTAVDAAWMKRVKQVVDYVIDEGMYCILNVHHDTGASNTAWLVADEHTYNLQHERFETLWKQIANTFRDYDEHLLFEGYNEMLDEARSWCFASFGASGNYDVTMATSAYKAINNYAQSFVDAVRSTGGNNAQRNLIVCTYGACSGEGTWSPHLKEPLTQMALPNDEEAGHIAFEVHAYPSISNLTTAKSSVLAMMKQLKSTLGKKGPVIIGEWGTSDGEDYAKNHDKVIEFSQYFVQTAKTYGIATFHWMGLSDGSSRSVPEFNEADRVEAIVKGYYGDEGYTSIGSSAPLPSVTSTVICDISGRVLHRPTKGLNVVRRGDGSVRKVLER